MAKPETIQLTWEISDGYVGGKRPQKALLHISELEYCHDENDVRNLVSQTIQDAFENRIGPDWEPSETEKAIEKWKELKAAEKA